MATYATFRFGLQVHFVCAAGYHYFRLCDFDGPQTPCFSQALEQRTARPPSSGLALMHQTHCAALLKYLL